MVLRRVTARVILRSKNMEPPDGSDKCLPSARRVHSDRVYCHIDKFGSYAGVCYHVAHSVYQCIYVICVCFSGPSDFEPRRGLGRAAGVIDRPLFPPLSQRAGQRVISLPEKQQLRVRAEELFMDVNKAYSI